MPVLKSIRYQKNDKFNNIVMIASKSKPHELENYETLKKYAEKLEEKNYETYLPIFNSEQYNYSTIKLFKNEKFKFVPNVLYDVDYKITTIAKNSKIYVNCHIQKCKTVGKAPADDIGEELDLD